jgi:UDP-sulfoquinovose synthase
LQPTTLSEGLLEEVYEIAQRHRERVNWQKIISDSRWRADIPADREGTSVRPEGPHFSVHANGMQAR